MTAFGYETSSLPLRGDLLEAQRRAWQRIARPGTWWTGEERVAIAAETRKAGTCLLCRERKAAPSPFAATRKHESHDRLPEAAVDVVHRIRTDPGGLTKRWFREVRREIADAPYVEIVGVVVTVVGVDTFARGIGALPPPLPAPVEGPPSRIRPAAAKQEGAWVPMISVEDATGDEADLYGAKAFVPNVRRALSLVPAEARGFAELGAAHYFSIDEMMDVTLRRALTRPQIELLAGRVSALNGCFY